MAGRVEHASRAGPEFPGPVERAAGTAEPTGRHLHLDDYPQTLELLRALVGHRADLQVGSSGGAYGHGVFFPSVVCRSISLGLRA
jgi:hypothetical protein